MIKILIVNCVLTLITGPNSFDVKSLDGRFILSHQNNWKINFCNSLDKSYLKWNNCIKEVDSNKCMIIKGERK